MNKIPEEILKFCLSENCLQNVIAILPTDGDAGFEDFFFRKAEEVRKKKHLFADRRKTALLLTYPSPPDEKSDRRYAEMLFERFFESPVILANSQVYHGCFGIDISAYLSDTTNNKLLDLMAYIRNTPETTYVLFAYTNNTNEADGLIAAVNQYADFIPVRFSLPDEKTLAGYILDQTGEYCGQTEEALEDYLAGALKDLKLGYDSAELIIKYLKSQNYNGTLDEAKDHIPDAIRTLQLDGRSSSFGY